MLKKLGDGLMALFGYPQAQENDAERAVRAALALQRALGELNARNAARGAPELSARIGIETGPVVVDATGEVFGEAPNVAARVQAAAEPGSILAPPAFCSGEQQGFFVVEEQGRTTLKGVNSRSRLYRVVRASGGGRRGKGSRGAEAPLVGREGELALLTRRWSRALKKARASSSQIVGEPGIGKSRLIRLFRRKTRGDAANLGPNGPPHSSCKTRPCTRSPNGADCVLAASTRPTRGVSPTSRTPYVWLASIGTNTRP